MRYRKSKYYHYLGIRKSTIIWVALTLALLFAGSLFIYFGFGQEAVIISPVSEESITLIPTGIPAKKAWKPFANTSYASYYCEGFEGNHTASGEIYSCDALTFAHKTMKFGTKVRFLYDPDGDGQGNVVEAVCNDRGPFIAGRDFDFSETVFKRLAPSSRGVIRVRWEVVDN